MSEDDRIRRAWARVFDSQERFTRVYNEAQGLIAVAADTRSQAVRELVALGVTRADIAEALGLSLNTMTRITGRL